MAWKILFSFFLLTVSLSLEGPAVEIRLPKTGQVNCFDGVWGYQVKCRNSGQDGGYLTEAPWPSPRFTNPDGTLPISGEGILDRLVLHFPAPPPSA